MSDDVQKVNGTWNDMPCSIKKVWGKNDNWEGHEFSAEECAQLFNGEIIEFEAISKKGTPYTCKGKLDKQSFTDSDGNTHEYVGFTPIFEEKKDDVERFKGTWNNRQVNVKRLWGKNDNWEGHRFTDEEVERLLNSEIIEFSAISKKGSNYTATGQLAVQSFTDEKTGKDVEYVGFKLIFNN